MGATCSSRRDGCTVEATHAIMAWRLTTIEPVKVLLCPSCLKATGLVPLLIAAKERKKP